MHSSSLLTLKQVKKQYRPDQPALFQELSFELAEGEFCILLGNNGSGKSTFLKCISGDLALEGGEIWFRNREVTSWTRSERAFFVNLLQQDPLQSCFPELSLLENAVLYRLKKHPPSWFRWTETHRSILETEMSLLPEEWRIPLDQPLGSLSGGQRQRLVFFLSTLSEAPLILLDEPTSALDPLSRKALLNVIQTRQRQKKFSVLLITHHLEEALAYGDRLLLLHEGQWLLDLKGSEKQALTKEKLLNSFSGTLA